MQLSTSHILLLDCTCGVRSMWNINQMQEWNAIWTILNKHIYQLRNASSATHFHQSYAQVLCKYWAYICSMCFSAWETICICMQTGMTISHYHSESSLSPRQLSNGYDNLISQQLSHSHHTSSVAVRRPHQTTHNMECSRLLYADVPFPSLSIYCISEWWPIYDCDGQQAERVWFVLSVCWNWLLS